MIFVGSEKVSKYVDNSTIFIWAEPLAKYARGTLKEKQAWAMVRSLINGVKAYGAWAINHPQTHLDWFYEHHRQEFVPEEYGVYTEEPQATMKPRPKPGKVSQKAWPFTRPHHR